MKKPPSPTVLNKLLALDPGTAWDFTGAAHPTGNQLTAGQRRAVAPLIAHGVPETIDADAIRFEASRRIGAFAPDWQQRNVTARSVELTVKIAEGETLTTEEAAERTNIEAYWAQVKAIRSVSNAITAEDPLPADYPALVERFEALLAEFDA